jgi:hypothetical protein
VAPSSLGTLKEKRQLNMGVNGFDFGCESRGSGPRIAVMTSLTMRRKPIGANTTRTDLALAA